MSSVATGAEHALAVSMAGELFTWGHGANGRLGHAEAGGRLWFWNRDEALPRRVNHLAGESIRSVAAGHMHSGQLGGLPLATCCTTLSCLCAAAGRLKAPLRRLRVRRMHADQAAACAALLGGAVDYGLSSIQALPWQCFYGANAAALPWLLCTAVCCAGSAAQASLAVFMQLVIAACPGEQRLFLAPICTYMLTHTAVMACATDGKCLRHQLEPHSVPHRLSAASTSVLCAYVFSGESPLGLLQRACADGAQLQSPLASPHALPVQRRLPGTRARVSMLCFPATWRGSSCCASAPQAAWTIAAASTPGATAASWHWACPMRGLQSRTRQSLSRSEVCGTSRPC